MLWIVFPLLLIGFLWICLRQPERTEHDMYLANRPSLTDDEFLSLCDPEVDPSIALKVREIIADIACIAENEIYPSDRLIEDLQLDRGANCHWFSTGCCGQFAWVK